MKKILQHWSALDLYIQVQQRWLWLLRMPTRWPDSWLSCPPLLSLLPCGCQGEETHALQEKKMCNFVELRVNLREAALTTCRGSLSTCQRWCWRSHLRAASSMQRKLSEESGNSHTERLCTHTDPVPSVFCLPSLQQWKVPVRLVSITAFQPLEETCSAGLLNWPPPLFTR